MADAIRFVRLGEARTVQADAIKFTPNTAEPLLYVHADHLGTPQKATDASGAVVWNAVYLPYGAAHSITGSITYNQRFPGQYFDAETGLHYNYRRDYDPAVGRYVQSDPIGLLGGINRYAYVEGNPLSKMDPRGQQAAPPIPIGPGLPLPIPPIAQPGTPQNEAWTKWVLNLFKGRHGGGKHPDADCEEEWRDARVICLRELNKPNPNCGLTGGYKDVESCARGLVSERCGGNAVKK